jgi:transcriptional regulator
LYVPPAFAHTDSAELAAFVREHSFALLISGGEGALEASHLPLFFESATDGRSVLYGHMARANTHWQRAEGNVLAVFSGPHAYISPTWYEARQVVPTWNYAAVHISGQLSIIDDPDESLVVLQRLVEFYERGRPEPWRFDFHDEWIRKLAAAIVTFRIDVTSVEGKLKMSQNQPLERRTKVIAALERDGDDASLAVAALIRKVSE